MEKKRSMDTILDKIYKGILDGQQKQVGTAVQEALDAGRSPKSVLDGGMVAAMTEVGRLFEIGEYFVPEMLIAARAMQAGMAVLKPRLKEAHVASTGVVGIGTVKGDLHDIGKNLVGMMFEGAGFEVIDLGTDVSPERFVEVADRVDLIALSALLTTTMPGIKDTIDALQTAGKREKVKVIIGGAPVTEEYARIVGADGYAPDASRASSLAKTLIASSNMRERGS
jgi:5-methyltetrahydrofolate--homocysteine methyltransferase